ncbi:hypothetical protein ACVR0A_03140 [Streptococcus downei]|uniref:Membrane protein n=1 Tax=Streptococcus downei MFe28 TaxID=764290 RepID=A0A380JDS8_STRDO|nr:hypothetical protein [Streptococcus downei]EFQ57386.1 hypothetical protein HMPREF9176_1448 [Streptococcus downei F0415]SUN36256.1 membrane protein [Streptococcus downei MFe28]
MISIEKLESNLKSLNMTLFIWKLLSLASNVLSIVGYYMNIAILKHPKAYEKSGVTKEQIELLRRTMTPWFLVTILLALVFNAILVYLLFRNHRAVKNKDYISYWPYYLSLAFIILPIINQVLSGFSWFSTVLYLVQVVLIVFTYLKAKQLNEVG